MNGPAVRGRLRRRLTAAFILIAAICSSGLATGSYLLVQRAWLEDSQQRAGEDTLRQLALAEQFLPDPDHQEQLRASFAAARRDVLVAVDGKVVPSNPGVNPPLPQSLRTAVAQGQLAYHRLDHQGRHLLVVGGRIGGSRDELYVLLPEDRIFQNLAQLRTILLSGTLTVTALAAVVGYALARRTLEPVARAGAAAQAMAEGLLDTRLPVNSGDEFGAWAMSFNRMAAALEEKVTALSQARQRERQFTADVAHELRTPVTALTAAASLLREHLASLPEAARRPAELLVDDVVRLRRLVGELMEVSRLDGGEQALTLTQVDLAALVNGVAAAGGSDRIEVRASPSVVETDPRRVERVVANLVANAIEHGGGGVLRLRVAGEVAEVEVTDHGPGIAAEHLTRLFDRFYKADPSRSSGGSGLGLAIAQQHALILGGRIEVASQPGKGSTFRFTWPVTRLLRDGEGAVGGSGDRRDKTTDQGAQP